MSSLKQSEFLARFALRPQNYAWFLGAGTSRSSGLRTASDVLLDLKRRYFKQEENQDVSLQDMQNEAVQARVQSFMDSRGFPEFWSDGEYPTYFEMIFGEDKERQRKYVSSILSEKNVTLSVGNRVLGALMSENICRVVFTTNFDTVVEKAVAEMARVSLSPYHLEGGHNAKNALDNEEYPFYCKLHGDFRYDTIKNLPNDLAKQSDELSACLINAANRFGFVVIGYSGRDKSVMDLFNKALQTTNPFPHGLYWMGVKGAEIHPAVTKLIDDASSRGVDAHYVEIETFDVFMLRLWRSIDNKPAILNERVHKARLSDVKIEIPAAGSANPIVRLNAFPILSAPKSCLSVSLKSHKEWRELREVSQKSEHSFIFTKTDTVWCWGKREGIVQGFGDDIGALDIRNVPDDLNASGNLHVKGFIEEALCLALARGKPLLSRTGPSSAYLIADPHTEDVGGLDPLFRVVGKTSGIIPGLFSQVTAGSPRQQQVSWSEALSLSVDYKNGQLWLLVDPDIWIWPRSARRDASKFLSRHKSDRFNRKFNLLLDAWKSVIWGDQAQNVPITVSAFDSGDNVENPVFCIGNRTAFSRRLVG